MLPKDAGQIFNSYYQKGYLEFAPHYEIFEKALM